MPGIPSIWGASPIDDPDAIKAASLDERPFESSSPISNELAVDSSIDAASKIFDVAEQQTTETKFIKPGDILTALTLGAGAVMSGGMSLLGGAGVGLMGGEMLRRDRVQTDDVLSAQKENKFIDTAAGFVGNSTNLNVAKLNNMPGPAKPPTGMTQVGTLESMQQLAATGNEEAYRKFQQQIAQWYPQMAAIDMQTAADMGYNKFVTNNFSDVMTSANKMIEEGYPDIARSMLGSTYREYTPNKGTSIFELPGNEVIMEYVSTNKLLSNNEKDQIYRDLALLNRTDPKGYDEALSDLRNMPTDMDAFRQRQLLRMEQILSSQGAKLPPQVQAAYRTYSETSNLLYDFTKGLMAPPEVRDDIFRQWRTSSAIINAYLEKSSGSDGNESSEETITTQYTYSAERTQQQDTVAKEMKDTVSMEKYKMVEKAADEVLKTAPELAVELGNDPLSRQYFLNKLRKILAATDPDLAKDPTYVTRALDYAIAQGGSDGGQ